MKRFIIFLMVLQPLICQVVNAQIVSREEASIVAKQHLLSLKKESYEVEHIQGSYSANRPLIYRIDFRNGTWCIVSGDMRFEPILAFGFSRFDNDSIPEAFAMLIEDYKEQINSIISTEHRDSAISNPLWERYLHPTKSFPNYQLGDALLDKGRPDTMRLSWNQEFNNSVYNNCNPSYNQDCPDASNINFSCVLYAPDECNCGHKPAGCAPVAMGQVMWYWQWPRRSCYGKYQWEHMPPFIDNSTSSWEASNISKLLRNIGDATQTEYCCKGSFTLWPSVTAAFCNVFGYATVKQHQLSNWHYGTSWIDLIKSEIDNNRPVVYYGDPGLLFWGHYFVVDGYKDFDGQLRFHANWGHGGKYDAFCKLDGMKENMNGTMHYYDNNIYAFVGISPTYSDEDIDSLTYSWVPSYRDRKEYAYRHINVPKIGRELIVDSGAHLLLEAGMEIVLQPGFYAQPGSEVHVHIDPEWQNEMEILLTSYPLSVNIWEEYKIETKNADSWELTVEKRSSGDTTIIFQNAGIIRSDITAIWYITDQFTEGIYYGRLALKNSYGRRLERQIEFQIQQERKSAYNNEYSMDSILYDIVNDMTNNNLYPNPTSGEVTVGVDGEVQSIIIYTPMGLPVGGWRLLSIAPDRVTLDLSPLPAGTYILHIQTPLGISTKRLVVAR